MLIPVATLIDRKVVVPDLIVSDVAHEFATSENSMSVAPKLGELIYDCSVRLGLINFCNSVILLCVLPVECLFLFSCML